MQDLVLGTAIHRRKRIIQDQDFSIQQQRAGNRNTLFCPPDSITPRSPTSVSYPAAGAKYRHARWQTRHMFNLFLRRRGVASAMLFATVSENKNGVWLTTARRLRQSSSSSGQRNIVEANIALVTSK
jgi:hypothetical protein